MAVNNENATEPMEENALGIVLNDESAVEPIESNTLDPSSSPSPRESCVYTDNPAIANQ